MSVFAKLDGALAVLRKRGGIHVEAELFLRRTDKAKQPLPALYAKMGSGYIPLLRDNGTPCKHITWDEIILPPDAQLSKGSLGYLAVVKA